MELVPVRTIEWEVHQETGLVHLKRLKFRSPLLKKLILPIFSEPYFKIKLDEVGTFVWLEIDGRKTTGMIADAAREKFGQRVHPVYERLGKFIRSLKQSRFIDFRDEAL